VSVNKCTRVYKYGEYFIEYRFIEDAITDWKIIEHHIESKIDR
tara:strand:- start:9035 stop:9163 length:129 start_codon:yes stop_codon:yes gene_type:complete